MSTGSQSSLRWVKLDTYSKQTRLLRLTRYSSSPFIVLISFSSNFKSISFPIGMVSTLLQKLLCLSRTNSCRILHCISSRIFGTVQRNSFRGYAYAYNTIPLNDMTWDVKYRDPNLAYGGTHTGSASARTSSIAHRRSENLFSDTTMRKMSEEEINVSNT